MLSQTRKNFSAGRVFLIMLLSFMLVFSPVISGVTPALAASGEESVPDADRVPLGGALSGAASMLGAMFAAGDSGEPDADDHLESLLNGIYKLAGGALNDDGVAGALEMALQNASVQEGEEEGHLSTLEGIVVQILRDEELHVVLGDVIATYLLLEEGTREREFVQQISSDIYALLQDDGFGDSFRDYVRAVLEGFMEDPRIGLLVEDIMDILLENATVVLEELQESELYANVPDIFNNFIDQVYNFIDTELVNGESVADVFYGILANAEGISADFSEALEEDENFNRAMDNLAAVFAVTLVDPLMESLEEHLEVYLYGVAEEDGLDGLFPRCPMGDDCLGHDDCTHANHPGPERGLWGPFKEFLRILMLEWEGNPQDGYTMIESCDHPGWESDPGNCPYCAIAGDLGYVLANIGGDVNYAIDAYAEAALGDDGEGDGDDLPVNIDFAEANMGDFLLYWADVLLEDIMGDPDLLDELMGPIGSFFSEREGAVILEDIMDGLMDNVLYFWDSMTDPESPVTESIRQNLTYPLLGDDEYEEDSVMEVIMSDLFSIIMGIIGDLGMGDEDNPESKAEEFGREINKILHEIFPEHIELLCQTCFGNDPACPDCEWTGYAVRGDIIDTLFDSLSRLESYSQEGQEIYLYELAGDLAAYMAAECDDPECLCGLINAQKIARELTGDLLSGIANNIEHITECEEPGCTEEDPCDDCLKAEERRLEREGLMDTLVTHADLVELYENLGGENSGDITEDTGLAGVIMAIIMEIVLPECETCEGTGKVNGSDCPECAGERIGAFAEFLDTLEDDFDLLMKEEVIPYGRRIGAAFLGFADRIFAPLLRLVNPGRYVRNHNTDEQQLLESMLSEEYIAGSLRWIISPFKEFFTDKTLQVHYFLDDYVIEKFLDYEHDESTGFSIIATPERVTEIYSFVTGFVGHEALKEQGAGWFEEDLIGDEEGGLLKEGLEEFVARLNPETFDPGHADYENRIDIVSAVNEMFDNMIDGMIDPETGKAAITFDDAFGFMTDIAETVRNSGDILAEFHSDPDPPEAAIGYVNIPARMLELEGEDEGAREVVERFLVGPVGPAVEAVSDALLSDELRDLVQNGITDIISTSVTGFRAVLQDILQNEDMMEYTLTAISEIVTRGEVLDNVELLLKEFLSDGEWLGHVEWGDGYNLSAGLKGQAWPEDYQERPVDGSGLEYLLYKSVEDAVEGYLVNAHGGTGTITGSGADAEVDWTGFGSPPIRSDTGGAAGGVGSPSSGNRHVCYGETFAIACDIDVMITITEHSMALGSKRALNAFVHSLMEWLRGEGPFDPEELFFDPTLPQAPADFLPPYVTQFIRNDVADGFLASLTVILINIFEEVLGYEHNGQEAGDILAGWVMHMLYEDPGDPADYGLLGDIGEILVNDYGGEVSDPELQPDFTGLIEDILIGYEDPVTGGRDMVMLDNLANRLKYVPGDPDYPVPADPLEHPPVWMLHDHIGTTFATLFHEFANFITVGWGIERTVGTGMNFARDLEFELPHAVASGTLLITDGNLIAADDGEGGFYNPEEGSELVQIAPEHNHVDYNNAFIKLSINPTEPGAEITASWLPDMISDLELLVEHGTLRDLLQWDPETIPQMLYDIMEGDLTGSFADNLTGFMEEETESGRRAFELGYILEDIPSRFVTDILEEPDLPDFSVAVLTEEQHLSGTLKSYRLGSRIMETIGDIVGSDEVFNTIVNAVTTTITDLYRAFTRSITSFGGLNLTNPQESSAMLQDGETGFYDERMLRATPSLGMDTLNTLAGIPPRDVTSGSDYGVQEGVKPAFMDSGHIEKLVEDLQKGLKSADTSVLDRIIREVLDDGEKFKDDIAPLQEMVSGIAADPRLAELTGNVLAQNLQDGRLADNIDFLHSIAFGILQDEDIFDDVVWFFTDLLEDDITENYVRDLVSGGIEIGSHLVEDAIEQIILLKEDPEDPGSEEVIRSLIKNFISAARVEFEGYEEYEGYEAMFHDMVNDPRFAEFIVFLGGGLIDAVVETAVSLFADERFKLVVDDIILSAVSHVQSGVRHIMQDPDLTHAVMEGFHNGIQFSECPDTDRTGYAFLQGAVSDLLNAFVYGSGSQAGWFESYMNLSFAIIEDETVAKPALGAQWVSHGPRGGDCSHFDGQKAMADVPTVGWTHCGWVIFVGTVCVAEMIIEEEMDENVVALLAVELGAIPPDMVNESFFSWIMHPDAEGRPDGLGTFEGWFDLLGGVLSDDLYAPFSDAYAQTQTFLHDFIGDHDEEIIDGFTAALDEYPMEDVVDEIASNPRLEDDPEHANYPGKYYRDITIDHRYVDEDLEDFPVLVKLDETSFDFSKARPDGHDVHFRSTEGEYLGFERVRHDAGNQVAEYWVKIPEVSRRWDTSFDMFYGNPDAECASETLLFHDDFSTWEGWQNYSSGTVSQSAAQSKTGGHSLLKGTNSDPHGGWKALDESVDRNYTFEGWIYSVEPRAGGGADRLAISDSGFNGYGPRITDSVISIERRDGGSGNLISANVSWVRPSNDWYRFVFKANSDNTFTLTTYNEAGDRLASVTSEPDDTHNNFDRVVVHGGHNYHADDLKVRRGTGVWDDNHQLVWHMNDAGGTVTDSTGNNYDGTKSGTALTEGITGQALDFNGSSHWVDSGSLPSVLNIDGTKPKTVEAWAYTRAFNGGGIFQAGMTGEAGRDFSLRTTDVNNTWRGQFWGGGDADFTYNSLNRWVHFATVHHGDGIRIYADGNLVAERTLTYDTGNDVTFRTGIWGGSYFDGIIDEVRVSDTARSPGWFRANYHMGNGTLTTLSDERKAFLPLELAEAMVDILPLQELGEILRVYEFETLWTRDFESFLPSGWDRSSNFEDPEYQYIWERATVDCLPCDGSGTVGEEVCGRCGGDGSHYAAAFEPTGPFTQVGYNLPSYDQDFSVLRFPPVGWERSRTGVGVGWSRGNDYAQSFTFAEDDDGNWVHSYLYMPWFSFDPDGDAVLSFQERYHDIEASSSIDNKLLVEYKDDPGNLIEVENLAHPPAGWGWNTVNLHEAIGGYDGEEIRLIFHYSGHCNGTYQVFDDFYMGRGRVWLINEVNLVADVIRPPQMANAHLYSEEIFVADDDYVLEFEENRDGAYHRNIVTIEDAANDDILYENELGRAPENRWRTQRIDLGRYEGKTVRAVFNYQGAGAGTWYIDNFTLGSYEDEPLDYHFDALEAIGHEFIDRLPLVEIFNEIFADREVLVGILQDAFSDFAWDILQAVLASDFWPAMIDAVAGFPTEIITGSDPCGEPECEHCNGGDPEECPEYTVGFLREIYEVPCGICEGCLEAEGEPAEEDCEINAELDGLTRSEYIGHTLTTLALSLTADFAGREELTDFIHYIAGEVFGETPGGVIVDILVDLLEDGALTGLLEKLLVRDGESAGAETQAAAVREQEQDRQHDTSYVYAESPGFFTRAITGFFGNIAGYAVGFMNRSDESYPAAETGITLQEETETVLLSEGFESTTFPPSGWESITNIPGYDWQRYTTQSYGGNASAGIQHYDPERSLPSGTIAISGGHGTGAGNYEVNLSLTATGGAEDMRFRNGTSGSWTGWESYNGSKNGWELDDGTESVKTVQVQYRDEDGNLSAPISTSIQMLYWNGDEYETFVAGESNGSGSLEKRDDYLRIRASDGRRTYVTDDPVDTQYAGNIHIYWLNEGENHDRNDSYFNIADTKMGDYGDFVHRVHRERNFALRTDSMNLSGTTANLYVRVHARSRVANHNDQHSRIRAYRIWMDLYSPDIDVQPEYQVVGAAGETATFEVEASCDSGGSINYQWQYSDDAGETYSNISGATSATYEREVSDNDSGYMFRCIVTNGGGGVTVSEPAVLIINTVMALLESKPVDLSGDYQEVFLDFYEKGERLTEHDYHAIWVEDEDEVPHEVEVLGAPGSEWSGQTVDLSDFIGQEVKVWFGYLGIDADDWYIDDVSVYVPKYQLTAEADPPEAATVSGSGYYKWGETAEMSATVNAGYRFVNWTRGGDVLSEEAEFEYTMPREDVTLVANYVEINPLVLEADPAIGGTVEGDGEFAEGDIVPVSASPNPGYQFEQWTQDGDFVSADESFNYEMPGESVILTAEFSRIPYTLTIQASEGGLVDAHEEGSPAAEIQLTQRVGDQIVIEAVPDTGYEIDVWSPSAGVSNPFQATTTFTMPPGDHTLTANFKKTDYTLTVLPDLGGDVVINGLHIVPAEEEGIFIFNYQDEIGIIALPEGVYDFLEWEVTGGTVTDPEGEDTVFIMPADNATLHARFEYVERFQLILDRDPPEGGTVYGAGWYEAGEIATLNAEPATGYQFDNWTIDGIQESDQETFDYEMPGEETTITANFSKIDYNLTLNAGEGGSITAPVNVPPEGSSVITANYQDVIHLEAEHIEGEYVFACWMVGEEMVSTQPSFTFVMPADNAAITAVFDKKYSLNLQPHPPEGGTVLDVTGDGEGPFKYLPGTPVKLRATDNSGYYFLNWTVGEGEDKEIIGTRRIIIYIMPEEDVTLTANFNEVNEVVIPDENLRKAVEFTLLKPGKEITNKDMHNLYSLTANQRGIEDLTGLEHAVNLEHLNLFGNSISNLEPLEDLNRLESLILAHNEINSISKLSGLTNLKELNLSSNDGISNLSALEDLENLEALNLSENNISSVSYLSGLTALKRLNLGDNAINFNDNANTNALKELVNLQTLNLSHNSVPAGNVFSFMRDLVNVRSLNLSHTEIDIDDLVSTVSGQRRDLFLKNMENLGELNLSGNNFTDLGSDWADMGSITHLTSLRTLDLSDNDIADGHLAAGWMDWTNLSELRTLNLSGNNNITDPEPLNDLEALTNLNLSGNNIGDISGLSGLFTLKTLNLSGNDISDLSAGGEINWSDFGDLRYLHLADNSIVADGVTNGLEPLEGITLIELDLSYSYDPEDPGDRGGIEHIDSLEHVEFVQFRSMFRALLKLGADFNLDELELELNFFDNIDGGGYLDLSGNRIEDISPLAGKKLQGLDLSGNALDGDAIAGIRDIDFGGIFGGGILDLTDNWIDSLEAWRDTEIEFNHPLTGHVVTDERMKGLDAILLGRNYMSEGVYYFTRTWRNNPPDPVASPEEYADFRDWSIIYHLSRTGTVVTAEDGTEEQTTIVSAKAQKPREEVPVTFLRGRALNTEGNPMGGAQVTAVQEGSGNTYRATVGEDGRFMRPLPAGTYRVEISHDDYLPLIIEEVVARRGSDGGRAPRIDIDAVLKAIAVQLKVFNAAEEPLENARITAWKEDGGAYHASGGAGRYELPVSPGTYRIEITCDGYLPVTLENITVDEEGNTEGLEPVEMELITLGGKVKDILGNPLKDVQISALHDDLTHKADGFTGKDGSFSLGTYTDLLRPGIYRLELEKPGYLPAVTEAVIDGDRSIEIAPAALQLYGDVNNSGQVQIADAILALRHIVGITALDEEALARARISGDDILSVSDVIQILRRVAGLSESQGRF